MSTSLPDFYKMLENHDWFFMMSDDPTIYTKGTAVRHDLERIAKSSSDHKELFTAWKSYAEDHKGPRPERPNA